MPLLKNDTIALRPLEPEDLDILYIWENDPDTWQVSNTLVPFSRFVLKQYLETAHLDIFETKQMRLVIELIDPVAPAAIGLIDLFDFDPYHQRAGVGLLIAQEEQRFKGYGRQALDLLIAYCFNHLDLHQLFCNITTDNEGSIRMFKKAGFKVAGTKEQWIKKEGQYWDELLLQKINPNHK